VVPAARAAGQEGPKADLSVDAATRKAVLDGVLAELNESYVFPEVAKQMETAIRARAQRGEYDAVALGPVFADLLTLHLQEVSRDKHLHVDYSVEPIPERAPRAEPTADDLERYKQNMRRVNFGFERIERLPGNVGYLDLRNFHDARYAGETAVAAMNFLANTDTLIVDLRKNGGGDPAMVALLCSYLFSEDPVHLNDLYFRPSNETQQFWTHPYVPGTRYTGKDVYVLTSGRTFSGAEEFAYNMKTQKRATLVGDVTGGGANPGGGHRLGAHFSMFVPTGRAINPITKTNWEGTGVEPDVKVPADIALETAHVAALEKLKAAEKDPQRVRALEDALKKVQGALETAKSKLPAEVAPSVAGDTTFRLKGVPHARTVALVGAFNDWTPGRTLFAREGNDWVCRIDLPAGKHAYKFVVDGRRILDPSNAQAEDDGRGSVNSVLVK
jgi:retinol-binding protein 3